MTPEILAWLSNIALPFLQPSAGRVLEVGAFDVNGSPRSVVQAISSEYIGTDMSEGRGVDYVVNNAQLLRAFGANSFDTVICCECLEHDVAFWNTVHQMHNILKPDGLMIITTPALGFPYHTYPRHYVNFTQDAYEDIFFKGMDILNLRHLNSAAGANTTLAAIGRKC